MSNRHLLVFGIAHSFIAYCYSLYCYCVLRMWCCTLCACSPHRYLPRRQCMYRLWSEEPCREWTVGRMELIFFVMATHKSRNVRFPLVSRSRNSHISATYLLGCLPLLSVQYIQEPEGRAGCWCLCWSHHQQEDVFPVYSVPPGAEQIRTLIFKFYLFLFIWKAETKGGRERK